MSVNRKKQVSMQHRDLWMNNLKNDSRYYGYMDMQPSPTREQVHERVYQRAGMHIVQSEIFYIFWFAIFNRICKKNWFICFCHLHVVYWQQKEIIKSTLIFLNCKWTSSIQIAKIVFLQNIWLYSRLSNLINNMRPIQETKIEFNNFNFPKKIYSNIPMFEMSDRVNQPHTRWNWFVTGCWQTRFFSPHLLFCVKFLFFSCLLCFFQLNKGRNDEESNQNEGKPCVMCTRVIFKSRFTNSCSLSRSSDVAINCAVAFFSSWTSLWKHCCLF